MNSPEKRRRISIVLEQVNARQKKRLHKRRGTSSDSCVRFSGVTELWLSSTPSGEVTAGAVNDTPDDHDRLPPASSLWYSRREYKQFKKSVVDDFKETIRNCREQQQTSSNTSTAAPTTRLSLCSAIRLAYNKIVSSPSERLSSDDDLFTLVVPQDPDFSLLLHGCEGIVGLERLADKELYCDRRRRHSNLINAIAQVQANLDLYNCDNDHRQAILRNVCEEISRPSKMFARYLAVAAESPDSIPNNVNGCLKREND
ncbi:hypothetical protein ACA910_009768 [Epithemia clementina (nom. ined.)]